MTFLKGGASPFKGKHHTEEAKEKNRISHKGKQQSEEARRKNSESTIKWWKDHPEERRNFGEARKGEKNPHYGKPTYLKHHSEETKKKLSTSRMRENNPAWKGGIAYFPYCPKFNNDLKERVRAFFGYQCVECGTPQNGHKLHVHHVNFNKMTCCDNTSPLFVSLCPSCHMKTSFNREYWQTHFIDIIKNYYMGKCYLTPLEQQQMKEGLNVTSTI